MKKQNLRTLAEWLAWQETLHPEEIELGLERVREVAARIDLLQPAPYVITVAGTNGKGSSVCMLSNALMAAGRQVLAYTSPHLQRYNERVALNGQPVSDAALCEAFAAVEAARQQIELTYFEYGTLAALWLCRQSAVDVAVLEVGLGGRLDAVNIIDADLALVTNIGLDHVDWLGPDRNSIGREKAGIFRTGRPAVYNDACPAEGVLRAAEESGSVLYCLERDYGYSATADGWNWHSDMLQINDLPRLAELADYQLQNAAGVLMCMALAQDALQLDPAALGPLLTRQLPPGRGQWLQVSSGQITFRVLLDVAHNGEAVEAMSSQLIDDPAGGKTFALYATLRDKPVEAIGQIMRPCVDNWLVAGLDIERGSSAEATAHRLGLAPQECDIFTTLTEAWTHLFTEVRSSDRVIVFGSFYTVQAVLDLVDGSAVNV